MGAECSGKTTLAQSLAIHCGALWVPEVLRTFCSEQGRTPLQTEQAGLMRQQMAHEEAALATAGHQGCPLVFCDTAPLLTAIYSDYYFADASLYQEAWAWHARYDLSLLLAPDMVWTPDGIQRDGEPARGQVHALIKKTLAQSMLPWSTVRGDPTRRLEMALSAIRGMPA